MLEYLWTIDAMLISVHVFCIALQAYDQHLNMILGDVEETVTTIELDEETFEEIFKVYAYIYIYYCVNCCLLTKLLISSTKF